PRRITRTPRTTPDSPPPMTTPRRPVTRPQRSTRARRDSAAGWPVRRPPVSARAAALPAWLPPITVFTGAPHLTVVGRTAARVRGPVGSAHVAAARSTVVGRTAARVRGPVGSAHVAAARSTVVRPAAPSRRDPAPREVTTPESLAAAPVAAVWGHALR